MNVAQALDVAEPLPTWYAGAPFFLSALLAVASSWEFSRRGALIEGEHTKVLTERHGDSPRSRKTRPMRMIPNIYTPAQVRNSYSIAADQSQVPALLLGPIGGVALLFVSVDAWISVLLVIGVVAIGFIMFWLASRTGVAILGVSIAVWVGILINLGSGFAAIVIVGRGTPMPA
jgi:hypothetical protein